MFISNEYQLEKIKLLRPVNESKNLRPSLLLENRSNTEAIVT
jgi:hypothetical protein